MSTIDTIDKPQMGVVKLNVTDQEIAKMKADYLVLTINGIEDKAGFKKVYESRQIVKKTRISLEKHADELKEEAIVWQKKVNAEKGRVVGELKSIEDHLQNEEDKIEAEKERIRKEEEDRENARIQARIDKLAAYGFAIDYNTVRAYDDAAFEKVLAEAEAEQKLELAAKAEKERLDQEDRDRIKAERIELENLRAEKAESDRIIKEQQEQIERDRLAGEKREKDEADRIAKKKKEDEDEAAYKAKKAIDAEIKKEKDAVFEVRKGQLIEMGFTHDGVDFSLPDTWSCYWEQVYNPSDEDFASYILAIEDAIQRRTERLAAEEKKRVDDIEASRQKGIADAKKEADEKAAADLAARLESDRQDALRPDKEKLEQFAQRIGGLIDFDVKDTKAQAIVNDVMTMIGKMQIHILKKIKEL